MEEKILSQEVFDFIKEKEPNFLQSYYVLLSFYLRITNDYSHELCKDGRIVLTPKTKSDEQSRKVSEKD